MTIRLLRAVFERKKQWIHQQAGHESLICERQPLIGNLAKCRLVMEKNYSGVGWEWHTNPFTVSLQNLCFVAKFQATQPVSSGDTMRRYRVIDGLSPPKVRWLHSPDQVEPPRLDGSWMPLVGVQRTTELSAGPGHLLHHSLISLFQWFIATAAPKKQKWKQKRPWKSKNSKGASKRPKWTEKKYPKWKKDATKAKMKGKRPPKGQNERKGSSQKANLKEKEHPKGKNWKEKDPENAKIKGKRKKTKMKEKGLPKGQNDGKGSPEAKTKGVPLKS